MPIKTKIQGHTHVQDATLNHNLDQQERRLLKCRFTEQMFHTFGRLRQVTVRLGCLFTKAIGCLYEPGARTGAGNPGMYILIAVNMQVASLGDPSQPTFFFPAKIFSMD